jgi:hypothetical protein
LEGADGVEDPLGEEHTMAKKLEMLAGVEMGRLTQGPQRPIIRQYKIVLGLLTYVSALPQEDQDDKIATSKKETALNSQCDDRCSAPMEQASAER